MFDQKKPMEVIRQHGNYRLVKLKQLYYVFSYDETTDTIAAVLSPDRVVDELRTERGLTNANVQYVARGRKKSTALAYYNAFIRSRRRAGEKLPDPEIAPKKPAVAAKTTPKRVEDSEQREHLICSWCNGSGQDPRNIEWACPKC